jgi:hypothetical protein
MDLKVKIYSAMPPPAKRVLTSSYIRVRKFREWCAAEFQALPAQGKAPKIVFLTGFPRSGTTMLKYYYGSHPGLRQTPFNPAGFFHAWALANEGGSEEILIDKSNHYIYAIGQIFAAYGDAVRVCVIVRDPRDCIASFVKYQENREVPRSPEFWRYWADQHSKLLRFAKENQYGHCLHLIRYEDLVRFPEQAKAAFLQGIGFNITADDLDRHYEIQHPGESWHDSVFDRRVVGDHALQKWKSAEELPAWAANLLPAWQDDPQVAATMNALGYNEDGFAEPLLDKDYELFRPIQE